MATKLIELQDGTVVEVEAKPHEAQQISSDTMRQVKKSIDQVQPMLLNACRPVIAAWEVLNQEMDVEHAEVELGLSFTAEGGIYVVKGTATANLTIKLTLKPKAIKKAK